MDNKGNVDVNPDGQGKNIKSIDNNNNINNNNMNNINNKEKIINDDNNNDIRDGLKGSIQSSKLVNTSNTYNAWLYTPHTISALGLSICIIVFSGMLVETEGRPLIENLKYGIGIALVVFLILGTMVFPNGPFIRPHPILWRLLFGISVIYELYLIVLLFLSKSQARSSFKIFGDSFGVPLEPKTYAGDCSLTVGNVKNAVFDIFFLSHFLGWFLKSLMLRDYYLAWGLSIAWEFIEIAFTHMLPNFAECWWDSWILDVLLTNGTGIYFGHKLCEYLELRNYDWNKYYHYGTFTRTLKRMFLQFTPHDWTSVKWRATKDLRRYIQISLLCVIMELMHLNAFFLKTVLWIPHDSLLNVIRMFIAYFASTVGLRQLYGYMEDTTKGLGAQTWVILIWVPTELAVIFKHGKGEFPMPTPTRTYVVGFTFAALYIIYTFFVVFALLKKRRANSTITKPQLKTKIE